MEQVDKMIIAKAFQKDIVLENKVIVQVRVKVKMKMIWMMQIKKMNQLMMLAICQVKMK
jgi:hypothetical protein